MIIYKMENKLNGKVYIGQTRRSFEQRISEHINGAKRGEDFHIGQAIRKYGIENFDCSIIAETDDINVLNDMEEFYIKKYNSVETGYNLAYGGKSNTMDCPVTRKKHDRKMRSPEVRAKISKTLSAKIAAEGRTAEYTANMRRGFQEYLKSEKRKRDLENYKMTVQHISAAAQAKYKEVYCINERNVIVAEFKSVKAAAMWWGYNGYIVKSYDQLMDKIKESSKEDKFIRGLKWIYRV